MPALTRLLSFILLAGAHGAALPFLSNVFASHMVLPVADPLLWGFGRAGDAVRVTVSGLTSRATADAAGVWRARLPAGLTGEGPFDIDVTGARAGDAAHLADVLLGHVLLCGGQCVGAARARALCALAHLHTRAPLLQVKHGVCRGRAHQCDAGDC